MNETERRNTSLSGVTGFAILHKRFAALYRAQSSKPSCIHYLQPQCQIRPENWQLPRTAIAIWRAFDVRRRAYRRRGHGSCPVCLQPQEPTAGKMSRRFPHLGSLSRFEGLTEERLCWGGGAAHLYPRMDVQYTLVESLSGSCLALFGGLVAATASPSLIEDRDGIWFGERSLRPLEQSYLAL